MCSLHSGVWLVGVEELRWAAGEAFAWVVPQYGRSGSRVSERRFLRIRVTAGRRAQSKAFEGCVRVSRGARGAGRRACAREAPVAWCVSARVRGARAPQFSRTPPGGGGGAGVRVTSPRAPVIIARCWSRARIRAEAAAAASAGTVAPGLGQESGSRTPAVPTSWTLGSQPVLGNLPGFLDYVPALFSTRDRGVQVLRAPRRRRRRERSGGGGSQGAAGGGGSRPDG